MAFINILKFLAYALPIIGGLYLGYRLLPKLWQYVVRIYIGPFMITFVLVLFILLMQFVWVYVDDLMGKGLDALTLAELLYYASASLVPGALPLAILLSSIMAFGNLAERSELTAMKSAGMGLFKIMAPLIMFTGILSITAFFFSNYLWPVGNLKLKSMLYEISTTKPAFNLEPLIFNNEIPGYSIRVTDKDYETGRLYDVVIYDHTNHYSTNNRVIRAEEGYFSFSDDKRFMSLTLLNGTYYEEYYVPRARKNDSYYPHIVNHFGKQVILLDMSEFSMQKAREDLFESDFEMLNLSQLQQAQDTVTNKSARRKADFRNFVDRSLFLVRDSLKVEKDTLLPLNTTYPARKNQNDSTQAAHTYIRPNTNNYWERISHADQARILEIATNQVRNANSYNTRIIENLDSDEGLNDRYEIEWHRKFTLSFACIVLFFIGAPLGAIIRKGGLGMPVIISVILFLVFHILSITGEKMAKTETVEPWFGMWLSTGILFPLGVYFTYQAANESSVFSKDKWLAPVRFIGRMFRKKSTE